MASRPAQGNNSNKGWNWPRPAYKSDSGPRVVGSGTLSRPKSPTSGGFKGKTTVANATPKVTQP